jgi:2-amino-4-hydroxy-6-hydroxymethyldihydropteridine diphosphokinase
MIVVALGANLPSMAGSPAMTLRAALDALKNLGAVPRLTSQLWQSPAWPDASDPQFLNAVTQIDTILSPHELLAELHEVEATFGRNRTQAARNAPRPLDLDLVDYNGLVQAGPPELPHPRMHERGFVLLPLREIAPKWRHPVSGRSVDELIAALPPERLAGLERRD